MIKLKSNKSVTTIHGISKISTCVKINIFSHDLTFYVLNDMGKFDLILGMDGLRKINAKIDLTAFKMEFLTKTQSIHYSIDNDATVH